MTLSPELGTDEGLGFIHGSTVRVVERESSKETSPDEGGDPGEPEENNPVPDTASAEPGEERGPPGVRDPSPGTSNKLPGTNPNSTESVRWIRFGGQLGWADDTNFGLGARVELGNRSLHPALRLVGSFDYFFPEDLEAESVRRGPSANTLIRTRTQMSYFEVNTGVAWRFELVDTPTLSPYAGAGVNVTRTSFTIIEERLIVNAPGQLVDQNTRDLDDLAVPPETDVGLNLFGGIRYGTGRIRPFGELRVELGGGGQSVLTGGVAF